MIYKPEIKIIAQIIHVGINQFLSWFGFSLQTKQEILEKKVQELAERLKILDNPPSNKYIIEQAQQAKQMNQEEGSTQNALSGMWQFMKFNKRLQATEEAMDKVMAILNEFLGGDGKTITGLKSDVEDVANELKTLKERFLGFQAIIGDDNLEARLLAGQGTASSQVNSSVKDLDRFVTKDELSVYVKWPALEEALNVKKTDLEKGHKDMEKSDVLDLEDTTHKASDVLDLENKASDTESDGRPQTAPVPTTIHTPCCNTWLPKDSLNYKYTGARSSEAF